MSRTILFKINLTLLCLINFSLASFETGRMPPAFLALGSSGIARTQAIFFNNNPALLVFGSQNEINLQYRNFYNITQLNEFALSFNAHVKGVPLGLFVSQFGDRNYKEHQLSLALAYSFYKRLAVGILFHNYFLQIRNYRHYRSFGLTVAVHLQVFSWLNLASAFVNLNEPSLSAQKGDIPVYLINGLELKLFPRASLNLDLVKDDRYDFDYRAGFAYQLNKMFSILTGFRQQVHTFSFGLLFKRKVVSICYALEYHPHIGVSNALSVAYFF